MGLGVDFSAIPTSFLKRCCASCSLYSSSVFFVMAKWFRASTIAVLRRLTDAELDQSMVLSNCLHALEYYIGTFEAAVDLFETCWNEQKRTQTTGVHFGASLSRFSKWKIIAARDGAITIYHVATLIRGIMQAVHNLPSLATDIDKALLRAANKSFRSDFPNFTKLRHAVAHGPELMETAADANKNMFKGQFKNSDFELDNPGRGLIDVISSRCYGTSIDGLFVTYDVSAETAQKLRKIQQTIDEALGSLATPIRGIAQGSDQPPSESDQVK